jgi:hypothetical protein
MLLLNLLFDFSIFPKKDVQDMFSEFFTKYPDYAVVERPSLQVINNYRDKLPNELIDFWQQYGFGIYMEGYLKIVNPDIYQPILNEGYGTENNKELVFGVTGLGDFLVWVGDAIRLVDFRHGDYTIIETGDDMTWFFDMDLAEDGFLKSYFKKELFLPAKQRLGDLAFDECFGYVPILGAGGVEKVDNLQKVKIGEHISVIAQIVGRIE